MQMHTLVRMYLNEHKQIADHFPIDDVVKLYDAIWNTYSLGGLVFCFGNGGGASIAAHFASDLAEHPFVSEDKKESGNRMRLTVICLNLSSDLMTRIGNDIGYKDIFVEQLKSYPLYDTDLVVAFSGSGNSPNVLEALTYAKKYNTTTALIGGRDGGKAKELADISVLVPGTSQFPGQTGKNDNCFNIEDFQGCVAHMMAGLLKEAICES